MLSWNLTIAQSNSSFVGTEITSVQYVDTNIAAVEMSDDDNVVAYWRVSREVGAIESYRDVEFKQFVNGSWVRMGANIEITATGVKQGFALSGDGKKCAITGFYSNSFGRSRTKIFEFDGVNWVEMTLDIDPQEYMAPGVYGTCMSPDGNLLLIPGGNIGLSQSDGTYFFDVFSLVNDKWQRLGNRILLTDDLRGSGMNAAISADSTIIVDAGNFRTNIVYHLVNNSWQQKGDHIVGAEPYSRIAISPDGNVVYRTSVQGGYIDIYNFQANSWLLDTSITVASNHQVVDMDLSGDGKTLIASTRREIIVFRKINSVWQKTNTILSNNIEGEVFAYNLFVHKLGVNNSGTRISSLVHVNDSLANIQIEQNVNVYDLVEDLVTSSETVKTSSKLDVALYPNPASNELNIDLSNVDSEITIEKIEVYSVNGQLLKLIELRNRTEVLNIDVQDLKPGYYILKTTSNEEVSNSAFIIK